MKDKPKAPTSKPKSPTTDEHFDRIDATPEQLAEALFRMKPKKADDWDYMQDPATQPEE